MLTIQEEMASLSVQDPTEFQNLTLFPLIRRNPSPPEPGYMLLEDAIHRDLARVAEVSDGGSIPELLFENHAPLPVLLLDGEELVGAKQNRVLNLSILAPANATIQIPVSCVEAGRWQQNSPDFSPADAMQYASGRAARAQQVSKSLREQGSHHSDQYAIWEDIALKSMRLQAESETGAMRAMYDKHRDSVENYLRAFTHRPDQSGILYCIGGRNWGIDLLDHPTSMSRIFSRLVRGYALDAIDIERSANRQVTPNQLTSFLQAVLLAPAFTAPAVGLGKDVRIVGTNACGGALWAEDRYVHLCAFSTDSSNDSDRPRTGIARPSRRRG